MFRFCPRGLAQTRLLLRGPNSLPRTHPNVRLMSTEAKKSSAVTYGLIAGVCTVSGAIAYTFGSAMVDNEFRKNVEDTVPGAKEAFDLILGEVPVKKPALEAPPSKLKSTLKVTSLPPKVEKEAKPEKQTALAPPPMPEITAPPPTAPPVQPAKKPVVEAPKTPAPVKAEPDVNHVLENNLNEACKAMETLSESAILAGGASIEALRKHMTLVQRVLETNATPGERDEKAWNQVFEAATVKTEATQKANIAINDAKATIKKVLETIESAKANEKTASNPALVTADEKINVVLLRLEKMRVSMEAAQKEAVVVDRYRDLIEEGRHQFQREIAAILPHINLNQDGAHLSQDELNLFMTHAYQKVCSLQQELAKWKTLEHERAEQRAKTSSSTDEIVEAELVAQRRELELEYHRRMAAIRDEMENEMRTQLRRQAAAHADHISDVIEVQQKELTRIHGRGLDEAVTAEKSAHKQELAKILGKVGAIEKAVNERAQMDEATRDAQTLWLASSALGVALKDENKKTISLKQELEKLTKQFKDDDYVNSVLGGIPKQAATLEGISSEAEIKDRFFKVEKLAQQTALIGEEGGSLFRYFLSYLQSLIVLSPDRSSMPDKNVPIDIDSLSTFDIVWLARGSLERGDLEQAVKYMSLLQGRPKNVSSDWIKDAQLLLETQLACKALLLHAAAMGSEVYPDK